MTPPAAAGVTQPATATPVAERAGAAAEPTPPSTPRRSNELLAARLASRRAAAAAGTPTVPAVEVPADIAGLTAAIIANAALDSATADVTPPSAAPAATPAGAKPAGTAPSAAALDDPTTAISTMAPIVATAVGRQPAVAPPPAAIPNELEELRRELIAAGQMPAPFTAQPTAADIRALQSALAARYGQPASNQVGRAPVAPSDSPSRIARPGASNDRARPTADAPPKSRDGRADGSRHLHPAEPTRYAQRQPAPQTDLAEAIDAMTASQADEAPPQRPPHRASVTRHIAAQVREQDEVTDHQQHSADARTSTSPLVFVAIAAFVALMGAGGAYVALNSGGGGGASQPVAEPAVTTAVEPRTGSGASGNAPAYQITLASPQVAQPAPSQPPTRSAGVAAPVAPAAAENTAPVPAMPASSPAPVDAVAMAPPARPSAEDARQIKRNMDSANGRLAVGDIASARMFYQRAAELGEARAAVALAETFDPNALARLGVRGIPGDPAKARRWYQTAIELGASDATAALARLPAK